jgi:hypothetical protein
MINVLFDEHARDLFLAGGLTAKLLRLAMMVG